MTFQDAVRRVLTEKYADFKGRAPRSEYWWFFLAYLIGSLVLSLLGVWLLQIAYTLALIVPMLAVGFRRLQDIGLPGWYYVIPAVLSLLSSFTLGRTMPMDPQTGMPMDGAPMGPGLGLLSILGIAQLIVALLFLWWLTRPSQPETNAYGPPPQT